MDEVEIDGPTAAVIASGMLAVALADGEVHPREVALIEQFKADIPDEVDPTGVVLDDPAVREVFLTSLVMVALADGEITSEERSTLDELARAHGATVDDVARIEREARERMLGHFQGVRHFRDVAASIGRDLGLEDDRIDAVLDGEGR